MQILSFSGILRAVSFFQRSAFIAMGKTSLQLKIGLVNAIFNLIACFIAIQWGILAVAMAYVISDYLVFPIGQWLLSQLISLSWKTYLSQLLASIICTLMMALIMFISKSLLTSYLTPQMILTLCSLVGIMVYTMSLWLMFQKLFAEILALRLLCWNF
jgi:teichuronic acid exporter